jgi:beta-glucosidase
MPSDDSAVGTEIAPAYVDPSLPVGERVDDLLSRMSLDDKLGQMTLVDRTALTTPSDVAEYRIGAVLSGGGSAPADPTAAGWADTYDLFQTEALGTPLAIPVLYGVDAVHGFALMHGATVFPHNIGIGAAGDPALAERIGAATAAEVAVTGIDWSFGPCVCVARDVRWGRTYESFSEDPGRVSALTSIVSGLQGDELGAGPTSVLATAKHYIGDGGTTGGADQGDTQLTEDELRAIHLPPFEAAIERNVGSVMISFSSWNGEKLHGNRYLITDVLKGELGFDGFVVSDWAGADQIDGADGLSADDVRTAINAGIDMVMVPFDYPTFISLLRAEVESGAVPDERIDDATRRILTKKFELGLFERPLADRSHAAAVGGTEHRDLARQAVAASQVLLKNDGDVLPLDPGARILVAGKSADDIGNQSGGWTMGWQGRSGEVTPGTTILDGIREVAGQGATVDHSRDAQNGTGSYDVSVAVLGETPYAEFEGDRSDLPILDADDRAVLDRLRDAGLPIVVVLVSGRPMDITAELGGWDAVVAAWLPGTEGAGVADVLFGTVPPSGSLPMTWPTSGDSQEPLFPYDFGLTYD